MVAIRRINPAKTRRGKRILEAREPKVIENDKNALIIKGGKTNEAVTKTLAELYQLKKPLAMQLKRRNPFHPFEDETSIEKLSMKFDSSLFAFGANSKKHPNSLIFGRMYDYHLLDMAELRVDSVIEATQFSVTKGVVGNKPCIVLSGQDLDNDPTLKRIGNLLVDWFRGPTVSKIRLQGLETLISITFADKKVFFRVYRICLKKSTTRTPRVELVEMGPRIDFTVCRTKLASDSLFASSLKKPKELTAKKRKNTSSDVFGTKLARIHVGKQNLDRIQLRKVKALKKDDVNDVPLEEG